MPFGFIPDSAFGFAGIPSAREFRDFRRPDHIFLILMVRFSREWSQLPPKAKPRRVTFAGMDVDDSESAGGPFDPGDPNGPALIGGRINRIPSTCTPMEKRYAR
jgi:hypothetical protein